ncbi:ski2-like helicase [Methyloligella halotolerans]|uniref:Ski2-like helicase n=1 Tax=Methyloligella halotolerans TaxID=1177755 RepID=A0A1E2RWW1_9HYPH|nr:DEAD/DEAH box helicase [Methyloligella halotolerans]ODA66620.1 ski2-like helicase [Methyloligella halotolerans]
MNVEELRTAISQETGPDLFSLCGQVASAWHDPKVSLTDSLDLIVRLVAFKERFEKRLPGTGEMINEIARQAGLYPYVSDDERWTNRLVCEAMRLPSMPSVILHLEQMKVFALLFEGRSVILSAPTSFGKSLLVDALILSKRPDNVVIVVPTLALLDEYRKRLRRQFPEYNVITQDYQEAGHNRNIFVGTQERISSRDISQRVDLFVIDEFYKLDLQRGDDRAISLNSVMARFARTAEQTYLLGPSIDGVSQNEHFPKDMRFYKTSFSPVAADIIDYSDQGPDPDLLAEVLREANGEPTLIYVRSPSAAARLAFELMDRLPDLADERLLEFGSWLGDEFHPEWVLARSVQFGLGIHHGRVPRSVGQFLIHLFNNGRLPYLICTSTLIEGVNTVAKNVCIYDKHISTSKLDRFTFDNIKGRAGRMFQHFIGRIFLFHVPPEDGEFTVEIPLFDGFEHASDELVVHVPADSLGTNARRRRENVLASSVLPAQLLERWSRFGIDGLNIVRDQVEMAIAGGRDTFLWSGYGYFEEIEAAFDLAWAELKFEKHGIRSARQAAYFATVLRSSVTLRAFFNRLVKGEGLSAQASIDQCFNFLRGAEYTFPEVLRCLQEIVDTIAADRADYTYFAQSLQNWFLPGSLRTLDEFGVPVPLIKRYADFLPHESPDEALEVFTSLRLTREAPAMSSVEAEIIASLQEIEPNAQLDH